MAYATEEARQELLDDVATAADEISVALAALGEAYEELDEYAGERVEEQLFRPAQAAYARVRRTHAEFAGRHGLPARSFTPQAAGVRPHDAKGAIEHAMGALGEADRVLSELQDSMRPVEVGDAELRAGLSEVRVLIAGLPGAARQLLRTFGR
jgi:hypothetical protein